MKRSELKELILECKDELQKESYDRLSKRASDYVKRAKNIIDELNQLVYTVTTSKNNLDEVEYAYFKDMVNLLIEQIDL